jgi:WD40 repeat protein
MQDLIGSTVVLFDEDYEMEVRDQIKQACTTILTSTFSPDGLHLVCGTKDGKLVFWEMERKASDANGTVLPDRVFIAHAGPVYSLLFVGGTLVSGGDDGLALWNWQGLLRGEVNAVSRFNQGTRAGRPPEINSLATLGDKIVAASGDGNIYFWDPATQTATSTLVGHKDSVYCVHAVNENSLCSGGEDGIVNIWDVRAGNVVKSLEHCTGKVGTTETPLGPPGKHTPYISCLSDNPTGEFLVCGGGARILSLWNLAADKVIATMPTAGNPQVVMFYKDGLVSAGNDRFVYHWEKDGKMVTRLKTNAPSVFTISQTVIGDTPWFASAGTGQLVDLITEPFVVKSSLRCS